MQDQHACCLRNRLVIDCIIPHHAKRRAAMDSTTTVSQSWEQIKEEIAKAFSTEKVDINHVKALLGAYKSNKDDWTRFAYFDKYK